MSDSTPPIPVLPPTETTVSCPYCAEAISPMARKCRHCGEILDHTMREIESLKRNQNSAPPQPMVFMNAGGGSSSAASSTGGNGQIVGRKSRLTAALLAFFLGWIGVHKFYLGQPLWGIAYILFSWTFIPMFISLIEAVGYLLTSEHRFALKFG